jgi:hypothetical protein
MPVHPRYSCTCCSHFWAHTSCPSCRHLCKHPKQWAALPLSPCNGSTCTARPYHLSNLWARGRA